MVFLSEQWLLSGLLIALAVALIVVESMKNGKTLSIHETTKLINNDSAIVVDVRDTNEFKSGHIVNALNLPYAKLSDRLNELSKHKDKTIIVVDKLGQHSGASCKLLKDNGFEACRLRGGMVEWSNQTLPVVKGK